MADETTLKRMGLHPSNDEATRKASSEKLLAAGVSLVELTGEKDVEAAVGVAAAWKANLARLEGAEVEAVLRAAERSRKIDKVHRDSLRMYATQFGVNGLRSYLDGLPDRHQLTMNVPDSRAGFGELPVDPELATELDRMGMTAAEYQQAKRDMRKAGVE